MANLVPVCLGGRVIAYRPAAGEPTPKTPAKKADKKAPSTEAALTAEEATK